MKCKDIASFPKVVYRINKEYAGDFYSLINTLFFMFEVEGVALYSRKWMNVVHQLLDTLNKDMKMSILQRKILSICLIKFMDSLLPFIKKNTIC